MNLPCSFSEDINRQATVHCLKGLGGGMPHIGFCSSCTHYTGEPTTKPRLRGLGDAVAKITSAVGIKPCGGCKQRQQQLNKLMPFS